MDNFGKKAADCINIVWPFEISNSTLRNTGLDKNEVHLNQSLIVQFFIHGTILTEL